MVKLNCPNCSSENTSVYKTRQYSDKIIRYRKCNDCNHRFHTEERLLSGWSSDNAIKQIHEIVEIFG